MPNRDPRQDQQQKGRRNPMQTSPDDDEARVGDQSHPGAPDETRQNQPQQGRRRRGQDQNQDQERVTQVEDEEAEETTRTKKTARAEGSEELRGRCIAPTKAAVA